jgi:RNA polymerase sigma factor (sigma-70 family)
MIKKLNGEFDPLAAQVSQALQLRNDPTIVIDRAKLLAAIESALHTLTLREEQVLTQRYGLNGEEPLNREQVAAQFQVTRERIEQIEMKALRKLREQARVNKLEPFISLCAEMSRRALPKSKEQAF